VPSVGFVGVFVLCAVDGAAETTTEDKTTMAIQGAVRMSVPNETVLPYGALCLAVEPDIDWEKKKAGATDPQRRDKENGERVWLVRAVDLDPGSRRRQAEVIVKIAAPQQPVPPPRQVDVFPPLVWFEGLTLTPYADDRGRQAFSMRAESMRAPTDAEMKAFVRARESGVDGKG